MWFQKNHRGVIYGDKRSEVLTVTDRSNGNATGTRVLRIEPDTLMDFRCLPFPDGAFKLVAFDPPHLVQAGDKSWLAAKYGKLSCSWKNDISAGFRECLRVLEPYGTLIFKWNETQVRVGEILEIAPMRPLFGQVSGRKGMTHWLVFVKEPIESTNRSEKRSERGDTGTRDE